ncbi:hypothetical protein IT418_04385 [bacterium]|nr:hypothetical protein [bacterium]
MKNFFGFRDKNKNKVDDRLDWLISACAVILPFTTYDQLYLVYIEKQTAGVSASTWFLYGALSIPLFFYSLKRKETPMIILNGLWVIIDWAVWIGVVLNT